MRGQLDPLASGPIGWFLGRMMDKIPAALSPAGCPRLYLQVC